MRVLVIAACLFAASTNAFDGLSFGDSTIFVAKTAHADPAHSPAHSPRSVGRAGVGLVSDDAGFAMAFNPAAIARRGGVRVATALAIRGENPSVATENGLRVRDQAGASADPSLGVALGLNDRWSLGLSVSAESQGRSYPTPQFGQPPNDVADLFPTRYAGLQATTEVTTVVLGGAGRVTDTMAIGGSIGFERIKRSNTRSIWAGFSGREEVGDPSRDLSLAVAGKSGLAGRGGVGILAAPLEVPLEIAVAASARLPTTVTGTANASATTAVGMPAVPMGSRDAELPQSGRLVVGAGLRYLGQRVVFEADVRLTTYWRRLSARNWRIDDLTVVDPSGAQGSLDELPALSVSSPHFRAAGAADIMIIDGFLWLTSGYAFESSRGAARDRGPLTPGLSLHTTSLGAEAVWSRLAVGVGISTSFAASKDASGSQVEIVNPFGPAAGTAPAAKGRYSTSALRGALTIEVGF